MNLRKKLLLNAIIPLLLAVLMIGFIIFQMMQIQSSSNNDVKNLVSVEVLNADMLSVQQALGTFSYLSSDANAQVVIDGIGATKQEMAQLKSRLSSQDQLNELEKLKVKFGKLEEKSLVALTNRDQTEAKRQSLRTRGPLNDLYTLNKMVNESYQIKQTNIQQQISFVISFALIGSLLLLVVTSIISFISTTRISVPIKKLAADANRISKGDLTVKMDAVRSKDEVGQLNQAFMVMAENLKSIVKHIASTSEQVAASSQQLSASAVQTIATSQEMSKSMQEMAFGADHQMKMSMESAQAVEETTIGVTKIAESSTELSGLTSETVSKAEEGSEFVGKTVDQMNTIRDSVNVTDERIKLLNNRSKEIDDIVSIISAIAGQTNLLALNAAIEAARAGEYGKGFAVVADEVRKLAEETNRSAQKIGSIIKEVQNETSLSVTAMNEVRNNVENGIQITMETKEKFAEIVKAMDRMTSQIEEISATSEEISAGSEEVAASVQDMAGVAKQSTEYTRKAAQSADDQVASMEEINQAVSQLSNMATELENIINTFQMDENNAPIERSKK